MKLKFLATVAFLIPIWLITAVNAEIKRSPLELAQVFRTPDIKGPSGRTITSGGIIPLSGIAPEKKPTALIPETNIGLTLAEYPTFFVYLPGIKDLSEYVSEREETRVEFWLQDEARQTVYITELTLPNTNGIVMIKLPEDGSISPLEVGKKYQWDVAIVLDPIDRSWDLFTSAWIQRIEASPTLTENLQTTTPDNHPKVYAEAGIWQETLDSLATLRQSNPNNSTFITQWQNILNSVGLETVADAPLLTRSNQPTSTIPKSGGSLRSPDTRESPLAPPPAKPPIPGNLRVPDMTPVPKREGGGTR